VFRGYAPEAVDELVRSIRAAADRAREEIRELDEQARRLGAELDALEQPERELREVFVLAQREASERRAQAAREADAIRAAACVREQERLAWLESESARLESELERLRGLETELHESMRVVLQEALRRLEEGPVTPAATAERAASPNGTAPAAASPAVAPVAEAIDDTAEMPAVPAGEPAELQLAVHEAEAKPRASRPIVYSIAILLAGAGIAVAIWQLRDGTTDPARTASARVATTTEAGAETTASEASASAQAAGATQNTPPAATTAAGTTAEDEPAATAAEEPGSTTAEEPAETAADEPAGPPPPPVALVVRAAGGDSWLSVRAGSASGRLLFEGFLFRGESRRFEAERVWMRVGRGGNLAARLNGKPLRGLPAGTGDVLVTADGAETLALG
jgi:cell division septum initiation protein DivIVA